MSVRVGEEVEDHEAVLAAVDDQVRLVIVRRRLGAEDALLLDVLGRVLHVSEAPRRPDAKIWHGRSILFDADGTISVRIGPFSSRRSRATCGGGSRRP